MARDGFAFRSKTETVQEYVLSKIRSGEIQPGQRLQQDVLAEELGVSSTPVREALRRLEAKVWSLTYRTRGSHLRCGQSGGARGVRHTGFTGGRRDPTGCHQTVGQELDLLKFLHISMRELRSVGDLHACSAINDRWHVTIDRDPGQSRRRR